MTHQMRWNHALERSLRKPCVLRRAGHGKSLAQTLQPAAIPMTPYVRVEFLDVPHDLSIESAAHRWVARLEPELEILRARVTVQASENNRSSVSVILQLTDGQTRTGASAHQDTHVGVTNAFRFAKHASAAPRRPRRPSW